MQRHARLLALGTLVWIATAAPGSWPGFRGPGGNGVSPEKGLPVKWGEKENLAWQATLPGPGASSPVVWKDRIFVTCWSGYAAGAARPGDLGKLRRHLVCLERASGKELWQKTVKARQPEAKWDRSLSQHGYATSTPATDGERVYVFFGKTGVLAYDLDGKELWRADVGKLVNRFGSGASPTLWQNLVIVNATVEGGRLVGIEKATGKIVWQIRHIGDCWTTPLVVDVPGGKQELILFTPALLFGLDPATGKELWRCACPEPDYLSSSPVVRDGVVYVIGSGNAGAMTMAIRAGGRGDVSKTHVKWRQRVGASYCSPVLAGPYLYFFSGRATCLNADTGEIVFQSRLPGMGREYSSPVTADGKVYLFTRRGEGFVLAAKDKLEVLGRNTLGASDSFVASPAIAGGQLFVRSGANLYCVGKPR